MTGRDDDTPATSIVEIVTTAELVAMYYRSFATGATYEVVDVTEAGDFVVKVWV
jgi:hypothetical protein